MCSYQVRYGNGGADYQNCDHWLWGKEVYSLDHTAPFGCLFPHK